MGGGAPAGIGGNYETAQPQEIEAQSFPQATVGQTSVCLLMGPDPDKNQTG